MVATMMDASAPVYEHGAPGVKIREGFTNRHHALFPTELVELVAELHRTFEPHRQDLLQARRRRQAVYDAGETPRYLNRNTEMVTGTWRIAPVPADLRRRRVEITGPVNNTKMVINMLSRNAAGDRADCAMVDFEDSMKPSWRNVLDGIANVSGAAKGDLSHVEPARNGKPAKHYQVDPDDMAVLMVRVRGLHLDEDNVTVDDQPVPAGLFDLVTNAYHTAKILMEAGKTPKFYVPKVEDHLEARWWDRLFGKVEQLLGLERSTIRATFLIETLSAAFQVEEILFELRDHAVGLNVGRWDKIFSDIKTLKNHPDRIMADRASIGMNRPWMKYYAQRLIHICHRRGAFALGGMAAFTPGRDAAVREQQTEKVAADKAQEAAWGHDGCWVSHPYFIGVALAQFGRDNQLDVIPAVNKYGELLPEGGGPRTLAGLRVNVRVGIAYIKGWLADIGCVAWDDLMEDLATLEISRAQVWQWRHHDVALDNGETVTATLISSLFQEELSRILVEVDHQDEEAWRTAASKAEALFNSEQFPAFLSEFKEID